MSYYVFHSYHWTLIQQDWDWAQVYSLCPQGLRLAAIITREHSLVPDFLNGETCIISWSFGSKTYHIQSKIAPCVIIYFLCEHKNLQDISFLFCRFKFLSLTWPHNICSFYYSTQAITFQIPDPNLQYHLVTKINGILLIIPFDRYTKAFDNYWLLVYCVYQNNS